LRRIAYRVLPATLALRSTRALLHGQIFQRPSAAFAADALDDARTLHDHAEHAFTLIVLAQASVAPRLAVDLLPAERPTWPWPVWGMRAFS
jgi:hypothetical protein